MTADDLDDLLRRFAGAERVQAARPVRSRIRRTPECPRLPAVIAFAVPGAADDQSLRAHVAACAYCRAAVEKVSAEAAVPSSLVVGVWGASGGATGASSDDRPRAVVLGGRDESTRLPTARTVVLALADRPADESVGLPLSPEQMERFFTDPEITHVAVDLIAKEGEGGWWVPTIRLLPGPDRHAMTVTVIFPGGATRAFAITPNPPGSLHEAISEPADDVPTEAIEPTGAWRGFVSLM